MALAKKGTRLITVDEIQYRWVVAPNDEPGLAIVVEKKDEPGQRMVTWVEHGSTISPEVVRAAITNALANGWKATQKKKREIVFRINGIITKDTIKEGKISFIRG